MAISLKEVSRLSGVSVATLSRTLTGKGYLSPEMRTRAQAALTQTGYERPQPRERHHGALSDTLLIIAGDLQSGTCVDAIDALSKRAAHANHQVLTLYTALDRVREEDGLRYAEQHGVYGVVMLSAMESTPMLRILQTMKRPVVLVGRYLPSFECDIVTQDSYHMGAMAAELLVYAGHTRIAYLGGPRQSSVTQDKLTGMTDQLASLGLTIDPAYIDYGEVDYESGCAYAHKLMAMAHAPTAVFSSNELMAIGIINTLKAHGLNVPRDLRVICCDRTTAYEMSSPRLDLIYSDYNTRADAILKLIATRRQNPSAPYQRVFFDPQYAKGETVCAPKVC